jgi:serine-type D-Ala-D-Ala carboxypeptidase/endopeptidase (penicillin-binding protein 4)
MSPNPARSVPRSLSAVMAAPLVLASGVGSREPSALAAATHSAAPSAARTPAPAGDEDPPAAPPAARPPAGLTSRPDATVDLPKPPSNVAERRAWLTSQLDAALGAPALAKAKISAIVIDADTGERLYARNEKAPLNAASNVKIVTSAATLALLGPEYRWRTTLSIVGPPTGPPLPAGGEIAGDLYFHGSGDPTLSTEDLAAMVGDLAALGLHKVRGALLVDQTLFDGGVIPPAYDQKSDSTPSRAPSSAASLNTNVVAVTVIPAAAAGGPARIVVDPSSPYFTVTGRVVTAGSGPAAPTVETKEDGGKTRITVAGRVRLGADPRTIFRRVADPASFLGSTLRQLAERRGIAIAGGVRVGPAPAQNLRVIAVHDSPPLAVVAQELNKRSNNFTAEQLLRTLGAEIGGRPGTWDKGLKAVARYLAGIGIKAGSYQMQNGSGLYDSNRFSAEQIATVLRTASHDFRISAEMMASLAVAGTDGTIAHRMAGTVAERYVRAKTGTLANVSCLSGFAGSPGRVPLIFSILVDDVPNPMDARRAQDRAAELLVDYLEADSAKP